MESDGGKTMVEISRVGRRRAIEREDTQEEQMKSRSFIIGIAGGILRLWVGIAAAADHIHHRRN